MSSEVSVMGNKLQQRDEEQRKDNIIIFALQEKREESLFETVDMTLKCLIETMKVQAMIENIDYAAMLGRRRETIQF
jgi:hypothetical protein